MTIAWHDVIKETLLITSFVVLVMLIVEYINVVTKGTLSKKIHKNTSLQIILAAVLGVIPGCMGVFTVVSFYSKGMVSFGALLASMIATTGDESFFMLASFPRKAILLFVILFVLAIITGFIANKLVKQKYLVSDGENHLNLDDEDMSAEKSVGKLSIKNFNLKPKRIVLLLMFLSLFLLAAVGVIEHSHSEHSVFNLFSNSEVGQHLIVDGECSHSHIDHHHHNHNHNTHCHSEDIDWLRLAIAASSLFSMIIVFFGSDHFVFVHIWQHLIKGHLIKILMWTFLTLLFINILFNYAHIDDWVLKNVWLVLLIALLIGVIPESGPHLIFVLLYMKGIIPFSILLANSVIQNGHGPLPLIAESKKSFLRIKLYGFIIGGLLGAAGILFGF